MADDAPVDAAAAPATPATPATPGEATSVTPTRPFRSVAPATPGEVTSVAPASDPAAPTVREADMLDFREWVAQFDKHAHDYFQWLEELIKKEGRVPF